ncbi:MAG: response regulator [Akkermansiaceae bacterium]|nr:response regulator [Akkermansiaceae bacterium]
MPDIGGMEVLAKIRESHDAAHLPVIMVTANDEDEDIVRAFEQGASDFVSKPINFPVMCARVKTQLKLKRVIEELERYAGDRAGDGGD